jgi:4-diphosphocytidyl-2-C-methyl-D-erythritol kinase
MLTVMAPAKLNLTLEVLARRADGFHQIRSLVQTINLGDSLHFQLSQGIDFNCDQPGWISEQSLVSGAVNLLKKATGCSLGAKIEVSKRIPLLSGLGGDSSDAAATLRGLNRLWQLGLSQLELVELASRLGSDVAFFIYGGTALVEGRGEAVTPLPPLLPVWVVLVIPPLSPMMGKTGRLYAGVKASHYTRGQITDRVITLLTEGREATLPALFNVFDDIAFDSFTGLRQYWQQFLKAGAQEVHLAGSGPALFTLVRDRLQAEKIYQCLHQQGLECYLTTTLAGIDQI